MNRKISTYYFKLMLGRYLTDKLGYVPRLRVQKTHYKSKEVKEGEVICRLFENNTFFTVGAPLDKVAKVRCLSDDYPDVVVSTGEDLLKLYREHTASTSRGTNPERLRMKVTTDLAILGSLKAFQKVCLTKKRKISTSDKPVTNPEVKEALVFLLNELTSGLEFEINKVIKSLQANGVGVDKENTKPTLQ